jgi:hypothetical protein
MTNRILSEGIAKYKLKKFIHPEMCNPDSWIIVRQLAENDLLVPENLRVIHCLNESWRSLEDKGIHGTNAEMVDRDNPRAGSTLAQLYAAHQLT